MDSSDSRTSIEEIIKNVTGEGAQFSDIHGQQMRTHRDGNDGERRIVAELWEEPPFKFRLQVTSVETTGNYENMLSIGQDNQFENGGDLLVRNGNTMWEYNSEENAYRTFETENPEDMAGTFTKPSLIESALGPEFDVSYDGTEVVAGRETHVVQSEPKDDIDSFYKSYEYIQTWLDKEYYHPLKHKAEGEIEGQNLFQETTFKEVEFNSNLDEPMFVFEPPPNAKQINWRS